MRRGAAGLAASLGLALVVFCSPAVAAKHSKVISGELPARIAGAVTITWHGDPARGCAAAGVCDVTGSLTYMPGEPTFEMLRLGSGRLFPGTVDLFSDTPAIVRVRRDPPGGTPSLCVDTVNAEDMLLTSTPVGQGRYHYEFSDSLLAQTNLSAGRCTGPLTSDLRGKLPSGELDMNALRHGSALLNMSSRRPFASGPFSGQVVSTVGIRVGALSQFSRGDSGGITFHQLGGSLSRGPRIRVLALEVKYKIASLTGTLTTTFSGVDGPLCDTLDACGTHGTISYTPATTHGELIVVAARRLHRGEHPTLRSALSDLRAGRLFVYGFADTRPGTLAHIASTVDRPGDATCSDSATSPLGSLGLFGRGRALRFDFGFSGTQGATDGLRTRCPGPGGSDTLARGPLAVGQVADTKVGARTLSVNLSRPGTFDSGAYAGARSGALTLRLVRKRIGERVVHTRTGP